MAATWQSASPASVRMLSPQRGDNLISQQHDKHQFDISRFREIRREKSQTVFLRIGAGFAIMDKNSPEESYEADSFIRPASGQAGQ